MSPLTPTAVIPHELYQTEQFAIEWSKETIDTLEPLLAKNARRFVLFPIKYLAIWRAYKHALSTFWIAESIDMTKDGIEWQEECRDADKKVVATLLLLVESTNGTHEQLFQAISTSVTSPEARCFFGFQAMIENVHREALATLASICTPIDESGYIFPLKIASMKTLERKLEWVKNQSDDDKTLFSEKLLVFLFVQGLFTASTAAMFKWIAGKGILRCLVCTYNKISVDRENHINFASLLFYHLERRPSQKYTENLMTEMVELEHSFAEELIRHLDVDVPVYTILREIECVADGLLATLGYKPVYSAIDEKEDVDKKVTGKLKAMYFEREMVTAYAESTPNFESYDALSFDLLE